MAEDQWLLKEDGYLNIECQSTNIIYHPYLNVILVFTAAKEVKILDVNSGVILQSCKLSAENGSACRYLPEQDKILIWNGKNISMRSDYNGVLLLDTILQTPVTNADDIIKLEILLSEAVLFSQCLQNLEQQGLENTADVTNELTLKIQEAQQQKKRGIKAQKWETICLELPHSSLRMVASGMLIQLKKLDRHIPALAIASAINERLTDLLVGARVRDSASALRAHMYSEAARRETFEQWPHMDYKWVLPDQMAQAGFYHHPGENGNDDRAMCFTCNVCLVCWEKTDEPWSEHERHSPECPFVKGEYTQNVPLSITYATRPAVPTKGFNIVSSGEKGNIFCTGSSEGDITIWNTERQLQKVHEFKIESQQGILAKKIQSNVKNVRLSAMCTYYVKANTNQGKMKGPMTTTLSLKPKMLNTKIACGLNLINEDGEKFLILVVYNIEDQASTFRGSVRIIPSEEDSSNANQSGNAPAGGIMQKATAPIQLSTIDEKLEDVFNKLAPQIDDQENNMLPPVIDELFISKGLVGPNYQTLSNFSPPPPPPMPPSFTRSSNCDIICVPVQYNEIVPNIPHNCEISDIIPSSDNKMLLVVLRRSAIVPACQKTDNEVEDNRVVFLLFALDDNGLLKSEAPIKSFLSEKETPLEIQMLPKCDSSGRSFGGPDTENGVFVMTCQDGTIKIVSLKSLKIISEVKVKDDYFVSASYCKSLERLCGCTAKGCLHFYSFYDVDGDSSDERDDDTISSCVIPQNEEKTETDGLQNDPSHEMPSTSSSPPQQPVPNVNHGGHHSESLNFSDIFAYKQDINLNTLRILYSLTLFDEMLTPYSAEVPGCWSELEQAQKQRRHSQNLRPGDDSHLTKTWRLHNDATTWDEHLIELNLPKSATLGHVDFKFSLYQPCSNPPAIQVTLLKQKRAIIKRNFELALGLCTRRKTQSTVDDSINFNIGQNDAKNMVENPVLSEEYLQARNAEILVGPIELASCMDLSEQGGSVTLTSPKLMKSKGRNYLLHIKTMTDLSKDGQAKTRVPVRKKGITNILLTSFTNFPNTANDRVAFYPDSNNKTRKNDFYIGCDWLHEISITVRSTRHIHKVENERTQRLAMLESNLLLENLLKLISNETSVMQQNMALDILNWIVQIRMVRYRYPKNLFDKKGNPTEMKDTASQDMNTQQEECVKVMEKYLTQMIRNCVVLSNRSIAHKTVKLIFTTLEGLQNMIDRERDSCQSFENELKNAILVCMPDILNSKNAGALRWFTLLVSGVSSFESQGQIAETCVKLLKSITSEMQSRINPYTSLLRTRFGLYGLPFESEIFDSEPALAKNLSLFQPTVMKTSSNGQPSNQSIDLKNFCVTDGSEMKILPLQLRRKGIGNHFKGILEVEPLHYVCCSTSDATRLENIDSTSVQTTNIIDDILMENPAQNNIEPPNQNHVKDDDKENLDDDIMNNVKNILVDKIFYSALKKHKLKDDINEMKKDEAIVMKDMFDDNDTWGPIVDDVEMQPRAFCTEKAKSETTSASLNNKIQEFFEDNSEESSNGLPWHKLLSSPAKQMIVVERMHSGAVRYITLDFGEAILLTDLIIPACADLASLFIDIWCFEEEADSVRLVVSQDIGSRTLVLSDLQPPPICRYLKITITGRYGMSATRCKIPMGAFYGHIVIMDKEGYGDPVMKYLKNKRQNLPAQLKILKALYEDVHCRYCLSSSKLTDILTPLINSDTSNIAHMQAFLNRLKDGDGSTFGSSSSFPDYQKVLNVYEECISFQHQLNIIKSVIDRIQGSPAKIEEPIQLSSIFTDKLRVLSECLIESLLHLIINYGIQNVSVIHPYFDFDTCNLLFDTLIINGDTHIQLATCSMLVRMCCFQPWWGDFIADKFLKLFSSQNSRIFPQDRVFFLLTFLGKKSISMGTCRTIVIDAILKSLATLLAPLSDNYDRGSNIWCNTDLNLLGWIQLFLSVCLDDGIDKKDQSNMRWEFMSGETDIVKARMNMGIGGPRTLSRSIKKRFIQNKPPSTSSSNAVSEKIFMMNTDSLQATTTQLEIALKQQENQLKKLQNSVKQSFGDYFTELTSKTVKKFSENAIKSSLPMGNTSKNDMNGSSDSGLSTPENSFDKGLKALKMDNIIVVIRGLIGLILNMDFTCNMDLFLITCKIIARLVLACRPAVQLSKIITTSQLLQLIRIAVWENQQPDFHPWQQHWAIHAITCLLQDILEADKNYKEDDLMQNNMEVDINISPNEDSNMTVSNEPSSTTAEIFKPVISVTKDLSYADAVKNHLPSLLECDDAEMDDILMLDDIIEREKKIIKKESTTGTSNKNYVMFLYKTVSSAMDARLDYGLDTNSEMNLRRLTMKSSLNLFASLPQISMNDALNINPVELQNWPEYVVEAWCGPEYQQGLETNTMLTEVFDNILCDLHISDSWLNLEKILQLWLTLNGETLEQIPGNGPAGLNAYSFPKIPFGDRAVQGLMKALATHSNIKLRAWCLGFHCLILACKPHFEADYIDANSTTSDNHFKKMGNLIVNDEHFEKMLLRFFSGVDQSISSLDSNRYAGPTVCKLVLELFIWLEMKCHQREKLKKILLKVILHLVQIGGAISNQQGPIDAQSRLIKELLTFQFDKTDFGLAMSIIESVSHLVYNNIVNVERLYCQKVSETNNSNNVFGSRFGSLFATVLGSESSRQCKTVTDNTLLVDLLKLASILIDTKNPKNESAANHHPTNYDTNYTIDYEAQFNTSSESQTDEIKAEQQNVEPPRPKMTYFADTVLQHTPTMNRLLRSLSHCSNSSFAMLVASSMYSSAGGEPKSSTLSEPHTVADAVFQLLILLSKIATQNQLVVQPLFDYIYNASSMCHAMPKLQLSEPFLWYILKVLDTPEAVSIFAEKGGIKVLCESLVRSNRSLINTQPSLISMIMQRLSKSNNLQSSFASTSKKNSLTSPRNEDGLINFAPYCTISSENQTAQPADVLIQAPIASHRRARNPAWSYLFYPNESHVDLTITLPTAVLLKEIQLQPHLSTLASCPSAIALEITRDSNLGPIPITQPISTVGMTCIRLKFSQPEIATSVIIRLYRPRDATNIGLTQISVLGTTTFSDIPANYAMASGSTAMSSTRNPNDPNNEYQNDDDKIAKTSLGWLRILSQCFSVAAYNSNHDLSDKVITSATEVPGFLEACCSLLNIAPTSPNLALQNLETVLLKLGLHSREFGLKLINNLLKESIPQTFQISNDSISDLLYHLCTTNDDFTRDRIEAMLSWISKLYERYQQNESGRILLHATNPYSGFIKCLASILWQAYAIELIPDLSNIISKELFETIYDWITILRSGEPLKKALDAMLCSICCIRPELFTMLLKRMSILVPNLSNLSDDRKDAESMTDDIKQEESDMAEWYSHLIIEDLSRLTLSKAQLETIAMSCQSPLVIPQLIDSGLPNILTSVILEFSHKNTSKGRENGEKGEKGDEKSCLTDADKESSKYAPEGVIYPMVNIQNVTEILDFFTETCSEGQMREWLGLEGSVFWEPLLVLLCNKKLTKSGEVVPKICLDLEEAFIRFLSKVTACHPKNQEVFTISLISVINKSDSQNILDNNNRRIHTNVKTSISGFTRRLVLQILLESEKIMVAVRSDLPLQCKDQNLYNISNHPSKRPNSNCLLFYMSINSRCQEILEHCSSAYNNIIPTIPPEAKPSDILMNSAGNSDHRKELWEMGLGMEFLSVAAGVTAKDKRLKEAKNQATSKDILSMFKMKIDDSKLNVSEDAILTHTACPNVIITSDTIISQILAMLKSHSISLSTPCINLNLVEGKHTLEMYCDSSSRKAADYLPLSSPLQIFSSRGGLSLLAHYLPIVYPDSPKSNQNMGDKDKSPTAGDWVKVEQNEEIYEDLDDIMTDTAPKPQTITSVPQHSLAAFGLFLKLPAYSEVLLRDKVRAQCLLRLILGVTGDGEGNEIYNLALSSSLPTLPFEVFRQLLDSSPLTTDDGVLLRRMVIEVGAIHLVLNCLSIFTHHNSQNNVIKESSTATAMNTQISQEEQMLSDDKSHMYWAKGTGFGTGSTQQSWNVEQALLRQKSEEDHVTVLLQVLSSYINPGDKVPSNLDNEELSYRECSETLPELPIIFHDLLQESCLIPALSSYLRNDSVLDITRHIPLYRAILQLLRAISLSVQLVSLLITKNNEGRISIASLLANMKACVDTYASRLKVNKKSNLKGQTQKITVSLDDGDDEGLALLIPDIQETSILVQNATRHALSGDQTVLSDEEMCSLEKPIVMSVEEKYMEIMKALQFDTFEMIAETDNGYRFTISHHFETNVRMAGDRGHPGRVKRLAQETVTLSTSLPLSYSSSVFVRCDTDRLDIMKVLITGPADTPYANGCFEFDVYFPPDYPNSPMMINLETTGRNTVRFNPNLYNDGKVCLSVLNTWHGRPEEKWNAHTSSFLQVLVSIQSLILVPEPYFNEPGFERSRGTPSGTHSSREYNSNIYQACVRYAMLEQLKNPCPCFKDVINTHFWLKRNEICAQIEDWIAELRKPMHNERTGRTISFNSMVLSRQYRQLRDELAKLPAPAGLSETDYPFTAVQSSAVSIMNTTVMPSTAMEETSEINPEILILPENEFEMEWKLDGLIDDQEKMDDSIMNGDGSEIVTLTDGQMTITDDTAMMLEDYD